jgi:hypothetical protein
MAKYPGESSRGDRPLVIVDVANVMGSRPDGWWRDREGAARRLIAELAAAVRPAQDMVAVLEGAGRRGAEPGPAGAIEVAHAPGSGDDEIVRLVEAALGTDPGRAVTVVTADRGLRERVTALGAGVAGPRSVLAP